MFAILDRLILHPGGRQGTRYIRFRESVEKTAGDLQFRTLTLTTPHEKPRITSRIYQASKLLSSRKFISRLLAILSALGIIGATSTHAQSGRFFNSVDAAREYLAQNPTGARAEEAFRVIVEATLSARYPDFTRADLADGYAQRTVSASGVSRREVRKVLSQLANVAPAAPTRRIISSQFY